MPRISRPISYVEWLEFSFDHDPPDPWEIPDDRDLWDASLHPALHLAHLTRFFESPESAMTRFSMEQLDCGLRMIIDLGHSDDMLLLRNRTLPLTDRVRFAESFAGIYERCFAKLCADFLGHLGRGPEPPTPLNGICYMLWDIIGFYPETRAADAARMLRDEFDDLRAIERACERALERTLAIDHPACQEAAIHGLGHWQWWFDDDDPTVRDIIDRYLARPDISPELRAYAEMARVGDVQ